MRDKNKTAVSLKADYLRVKLLYEYGGLWSDVDCIAMRDFSEEIAQLLKEYDFVCMRKRSKKDKFISNGFIASRKGGEVIRGYLDEMEIHISKKASLSESYEWSEIGGRMLTRHVNATSKKNIYEYAESLIHPFDFTEAEVLQGIDPAFSLDSRLSGDTNCVMLYHSLFNHETKSHTKRTLLQSETVLGQIFRRSLEGSGILERYNLYPKTVPRTQQYSLSDIGIIFTTMARPECCENFLKSIRQHFGDQPCIYFAPQGDEELVGVYQRMAKRYDANVIYVDDDEGLSSSRNILVKHVKEKVIFLTDDDFIATDATRLDVALSMFNNNADIKILGGRVYNYYYSNDGTLNKKEYTGFNQSFLTCGKLSENHSVLVPSEQLFPKRYFVDERFYFQTQDTVNNFCLIDKDYVFEAAGIQWDDEIKIMGEHEDFYHSVQLSEYPIGVYFTNALSIDHDRRVNQRFSKQRSRLEGQIYFMNKWGLRALTILGKRSDRIVRDGEFVRGQHPSWFQKLK